MDNKKYEQLINLVINEDLAKADELFHEIVVEKSREIFESIMDEDFDDGMGGQVGDLLDEINVEETGMTEEEDEFGGDDFEGDVELGDGDDIEFGGEEGFDDPDAVGDDNEDAIIRIEDKLDQLMAEFEDLMGGDDLGGDEDVDVDADFDGGDEDVDVDADFDTGDDDFGGGFGEDDDEQLAENVNLQKVSVTHGDNGVQNKSPTTFNSGQKGIDGKPVKFSGESESVPTGPKGPSNSYSKGETSGKGSGTFKNVPGKKSGNLESAPKPKFGDDGSNSKSPVAESRRPTRRPIR